MLSNGEETQGVVHVATTISLQVASEEDTIAMIDAKYQEAKQVQP